MLAELRADVDLNRQEVEHFQHMLHELQVYQEETQTQNRQLIEAQRLLADSRSVCRPLRVHRRLYHVSDPNGIILDINLAGATLLGKERKHILGYPFGHFVAVNDRMRWLEHLRRCRADGSERHQRDRLANRPRDCSHAGPYPPRTAGAPGRPVFRTALSDLTAEKEAEAEVRRLNTELEDRVRERTLQLEAANEELRIASRRKDEFLAMLGHELRNPLAAISGGLTLLKMPGVTPDETQMAHEILDRQVHNVTRLVNDLLEVGRVTMNKIVLQREQTDLRVVVKAALQTVRPQIDERGHTLRVHLPERPVVVSADPRIEQVVVNLAGNAAKYTPPGGTIDAALRLDGEDVIIEIVDNGIGMGPDLLHTASICSPRRNIARPRRGGLGIGLTLVRRLVEMHGGTVTATSDGPGRGSRFAVRLPIAEPVEPVNLESPRGNVSNGDAALSRGGNARVLVVEDHHDTADSLSSLLRHWGYTVKPFTTARPASKSLPNFTQTRPSSISACRAWMATASPANCMTRRLTSGRCSSPLPAMAGTWTKSRATDAGFDHHFSKPVDPKALRRVLAERTANV